jgi:hypothetical protein
MFGCERSSSARYLVTSTGEEPTKGFAVNIKEIMLYTCYSLNNGKNLYQTVIFETK